MSLKKIMIAAIVFVGLIAVAAASIVFFFKIEKVNIEGNERYTDEEIEEFVFDGAFDNSLAVFWLNDRFKEHKEIPFVQKYDVEIKFPDTVDITVYEKKIVGYLDYMGMCMYFDKDGVIVESTEERIEGIPEITGVEYDHLILHEKIPVADDGVFDVILNVTQALGKMNLGVDKIYISPKKATTLYIGDVKVLLGDVKDLNEKVTDLKAFYDDLKQYSGTLDMSVLSKDKRGYILQVDKKKEAETTGEVESETQEGVEETQEVTENPNVVANPFEVETNENGEAVTEEMTITENETPVE